MMRSLFSGVTGLRSHQTRMDVIGNNISNVNTLGFKKSSANFADLYSETTAPSSAPSGNNGGINARQIGLGVACNAIVIKHSPGAAQYTGNTLDLAISGDGFFAVRTGEEGNERYTRAGNLSISANGSLVTAAGHFVQAFGSRYQMGDAGRATASGFGGKSARGFEGYTYEPGEGVINMASGAYTMEIAENGISVDVYKNGVFQQNYAIQYAGKVQNPNNPGTLVDGTASLSQGGFVSGTSYFINMGDLGRIDFKMSDHTVNPIGFGEKHGEMRVNIAEQTPEQKAALMKKYDATTQPPTGSGKKEGDYIYDIGKYTLELTTATDKKGYFQLKGPGNTVIDIADAAVTAKDKNGNTVTANTVYPADGTKAIPEGTTYSIDTPFGTMTFSAASDITATDAPTALAKAFSGVSLSVSDSGTEGPTGLANAVNSLNTLLQKSVVTVANNDAYQATMERSDMIIDQDLYENVVINSQGAVVGQLKRAVKGNELGIDGAMDMAAGEKVILGYLALAMFANTEGLEKVGENLYSSTANSGRVQYAVAGEGGTGSITTSSLEMSNVDLSEEMVNMITTQRGFQANSRIITTSDTMLEELINLKR